MTKTTDFTHEDPEWVLMAKALRGELSAQEQKEFYEWLNADDKHVQQWADATETWNEVGSVYDAGFEPNAEVAWEKFCVTANVAPSASVEPTAYTETVVRPLFTWNQFLRYAAAILFVVGVSWVGYQQLIKAPAWTQVATLSGKRKMFFLPDSSLVTLNGNSSLKYQTAFKGPERNVELTGEAFFQVKKNPDQPFIIRSGKAQTKVLGTSFNVKTDESSKQVTVAVVTGKVLLTSETQKKGVILPAGYTGTMNAAGKIGKAASVEKATPVWTSLSFQASSIKEVSTQLETFFGVSIEVLNPELQKCLFTGTFENPRLNEILEVLAASNDITVRQAEPNKFVLSGSGCR